MTPALKTELTPDGKYIVITDQTDYSPGVHGDYTLNLEVVYKMYDGDVPLTVEKLQNGDHTDLQDITYDKWRAELKGDGRHRYIITFTDELENDTVYTKDCFEFPFMSIDFHEYLEGYIRNLDYNGSDFKNAVLIWAIINSSYYQYKEGEVQLSESLKRQGQFIVESLEQKCNEL